MKIALLAFYSILIMAGVSFADVTAEVLSYKIDDNGNIEVHTQYKVDGVEVQSRYPQENGKYYWVTRYVASTFGSMTDVQIKDRILSEIKEQVNALGQQEFLKKANKNIVDTKLGTLIGSTDTQSTFEIGVDNDGDHKTDKTWTVNTKGEKLSEKDPVIIP